MNNSNTPWQQYTELIYDSENDRIKILCNGPQTFRNEIAARALQSLLISQSNLSTRIVSEDTLAIKLIVNASFKIADEFIKQSNL